MAAGAQPPGIDPDTATRDELYQKAKKAGIGGRSDMTNEELAAALAGADHRA